MLIEHFKDRSKDRHSSVPIHRIIAFAIFSTRRQEKIIRITWKDLDQDGRRVLVSDMKNPGQKIGNDVWCELSEEALAIIEAMPKVSDQIFPYSTDAIGASFTRACKLLGINDLRFHDLHHDGVSQLFELGFNIPQIASRSGHRSWTSLKRYTHLRHIGDKYEGWTWFSEVTRKDRALNLCRMANSRADSVPRETVAALNSHYDGKLAVTERKTEPAICRPSSASCV